MQGTKRGAAYFFKNRKAIDIMSEKVQQFIDSDSNIRKNKIIQRGQEVPHYLKIKRPNCKVRKEGLHIFLKIEKREV